MLLPAEICASGDRSFAAYTLRNRLPHILRQIIQDGDYPPEVVKQLEDLGAEVLEGQITALPELDGVAHLWTKTLQDHLGKTWFEAPFFFVEMYFYRRIIDIINYRNAAESEVCDPFIVKKRKGFADAQSRTRQLAEWLALEPEAGQMRDALQELLLANLWSNCADLSQLPETFRLNSVKGSEKSLEESSEKSSGDNPQDSTPAIPLTGAGNATGAGNEKLLIDDVLTVAQVMVERWLAHAQNGSPPLQQVDIILDNTGIELISDLALADFLLRTHLAQRVILHAKDYPVFVSDATLHDIHFIIREMATSDITTVAQWGQRLEQWLGSDRLSIHHNPFWTLPLYFDAMTPDLQAEMNTSDLWIVKGDANYRRLVGDRHWPLDTPIHSITQYLAVPCLALRVLKCELLVGMDRATLNSLDLEDDWMTNGTYGIIQFIP